MTAIRGVEFSVRYSTGLFQPASLILHLARTVASSPKVATPDLRSVDRW